MPNANSNPKSHSRTERAYSNQSRKNKPTDDDYPKENREPYREREKENQS